MFKTVQNIIDIIIWSPTESKSVEHLYKKKHLACNYQSGIFRWKKLSFIFIL